VPTTTLVDLRAHEHIHVSCPTCGWSITLSLGGVLVWTSDGTHTPRCLRPGCNGVTLVMRKADCDAVPRIVPAPD
jgi:hypothetical protein